ncbi:hypothetical protein ABEB36_007613 [Hypothenemus hampei]|uniref:Lipase n=1 Tax=Hypothenemus hampei TaxID=57062 RepID=A0ABD1EUL0_HYPHA
MNVLIYKLPLLFVVLSVTANQNPQLELENVLSRLSSKIKESFIGRELPDDVFLNISQYLTKHGYPLESHGITTEDGYNIVLHRIPSKKNNSAAILFVPPLGCSSIDWVSYGSNNSLALLLADLDYDIWMVNPRGTRYSMSHVTYNSSSEEFWDFSFHEKGYYDVANSIDYILNSTGLQKLATVGFSEGTSASLILPATRPEYNEKISLMVLLSPIGYMGGVRSKIALLGVEFLDLLMDLAKYIHFYGLPYFDLIPDLLVAVCSVDDFIPICRDVVESTMGYDPDELDLDQFLIIMSDKPAGLSFKQLFHYGQEIRTKSFRQYDYGTTKNLEVYGSNDPPAYNTSEITVPVAAYYGKNDYFAAVEDVNKLLGELPNVADNYLIEYEYFNHLDFLFAIHVKSLVYDQVIDVIKKHI